MNSGWNNETQPAADWESWLAGHAPKFLLFARQQTRFEADAQDLVQEAVVECWRRLGTEEPPASALVFATIRRRAIDLGRSADRRNGRESVVARNADDCWFDGQVEDRERDQLLQVALGKLPDIYRDVITLKVWGELTFAEIAEALEISPNTAASRYRYGLLELRKSTAELFYDGERIGKL